MQPTSLARSRISYDELLASQVSLAIRRTTQQASLVHVIDNDHDNDDIGTSNNSLVQQCIQELPYTLTKCQTDVLDTINTDMSSGYRMIRLLQGCNADDCNACCCCCAHVIYTGDVGSGKTVVAILSMLRVVEQGLQACILAPTEVLATQHYNTIQKICAKLASNTSNSNDNAPPVQVALLTGAVTGIARSSILKGVTNGSINILVGTHAIYGPTVQFKGLGLAVIDEEQRFGVQQRNTLTEGQHTMQQQQQQQQQQQHDNDNVNSDETAASTVDFCESQYHQSTDKRDCHVLYMSATPIPRSLGLTVFGNIDVVRLNQKPPNSEQVQTTVVSTDKLMDCFVALKHNADAVFNTMFILQVVKR
eukprot:12663-Heterococcus_DN1.PRE.1